MAKQVNISVVGLERTLHRLNKRSKYIARCYNESAKEWYKTAPMFLCDAVDDLNHYLTSVQAGFKVTARISKYDFHITKIAL